MKLKSVFVISIFFLFFPVHSETISKAQCIQEGHWVYDALYLLGAETKNSGLYETVPLTVGELKFHFKEIEYESLSESGKYLYDQVKEFLYKDGNLFSRLGKNIEEFKLGLNVRVNPELMYKSNPDIDWSYNYFYTDRLLTVPIFLGFSDYFAIQLDPFLGKNYAAMHKYWNFTNIPLGFEDLEFHIPDYAVAATGIYFDQWGVDLKVGRKGMTIGNTKTGSIILNNTFETDFYVQLNVFTRYAKYDMDVFQINPFKYLYLHQITFRPAKYFEIQLFEGSLLNSSFELRYLNPLMIMHSFASWTDYGMYTDQNILSWYNESNFCAYFGLLINYTPFKNVRFYGLFSQNEIQAPNEQQFNPDSIGIQVGTEVTVPAFDKGYWCINTEFVYTSPFLYIKQAPQWSLYRVRIDNQNRSEGPIKSWIGTPFGPDCFAAQMSFGYKKQNKWEAEIGYILTIHGENNFGIFDSEPDENGIYHYYPYTHYWEAINKNDYLGVLKAYEEATNMWMSGIQEFKNQLILKGEYFFLNNLSLSGQIIYTFSNNNKNILGRFEQGIELSFAAKYRLF